MDVYDIPEAVLEGYWPDMGEHPLRQLRALCHRCMGGHQPVGEPFRFANEQIRITDQFTMDYARWMAATHRGSRMALFCANCDKVTFHSAKGSVVVEG